MYRGLGQQAQAPTPITPQLSAASIGQLFLLPMILFYSDSPAPGSPAFWSSGQQYAFCGGVWLALGWMGFSLLREL